MQQGGNMDLDIINLSRFQREIQSNDEDIQYQAAQWFRKIVAIDIDPPIDAVIHSGVVPVLVDFLKNEKDKNPKLQFEAAWALTNICSGTSDHVRCVVEANGAIESFIRLLNSPVEDIREQCSWALGNIAGDSTSYRDIVLRAGAPAAMAQLCGTFDGNSRITAIRNCMWTSSNLCRGKPLPPLDQVRALIPAMAAQVHSQDVESVSDACWALSYIADGSNERIQAVLDSGCAPRIIQLLGAVTDSSIQAPTLRLVGNIMTGNDAQTQEVIDLGVLPILVNLLDHPKKNVRKEACWSFSNVASGTASQVQAIMDTPNLIPKVIAMLENADTDLQKEATWLIANATSNCVPHQITQLIEQGAIKPLATILKLKLQDNKCMEVALEGIENILHVTKDNGFSKAFHDVVHSLLSCDILASLELLHKEGETLGSRAALMLETFAADFDDDAVMTAAANNPTIRTHDGVPLPDPLSKSDQVSASKPGPGTTSEPIVISTKPAVSGSKSEMVPDGSFLLTTSLSQPVRKGETRLQVASQKGCEPGMTVKIGPHMDKSYETRRISALGSLVLDYPLVNSYPAGTTVVVSNGKISDKRGGNDQRNGDKDKALSGPTTAEPNTQPLLKNDDDQDQNKVNDEDKAALSSIEMVNPDTKVAPVAINTATTTATPKPAKVKYIVGQRIQANFRGSGNWIEGSVSRDRYDDSYDVMYDNGDAEPCVECHLLRLPITEKSSNPTDDVPTTSADKAADMTTVTAKLPTDNNKTTTTTTTTDPPMQSLSTRNHSETDTTSMVQSGFSPGTRCEANYRGLDTYYPGAILANNGDGTYDIDYDDGEREFRVLESRINIIRKHEEEASRANADAAPSTNQVQTVVIQDTTEPESSLPPQEQPQQLQQPSSSVQPSTSPPSSSSTNPTLNSIIEDQLQGLTLSADVQDTMIHSTLREKPAATTIEAATTKKWRGGKILKRYPDGTYDIQLTNGGMLSRVKRKLIRAAGGSNAKPSNNNAIISSNT